MEFSKKSLNKQPLDKLLYNVHKNMSLNPFNNKVNISYYLDDLPCSKEMKATLKNSIFP